MKYLIIALICSFGMAKTITADYIIGYGIFDKIATAKAIFRTTKKTYHIKIEAKTAGFVSAFSNRIESFESFGKIIDNKFIPKTFINSKKNGDTLKKKIYTFDHKNRVVNKNYTKIKNSKKTISKSKLPYYAKDDLLTLFFSLDDILAKKRKNIRAYAVGADKKDGHLDIILPDGEKKGEFINLFSQKKGKFLIAVMYRKIFLSSKGELVVNLDKDNLCQEAILKDVLFYGDIIGKLVKKDVK